ncbi:MAG: glycosyltransferase family 2 protein [Clostridia bacterium]
MCEELISILLPVHNGEKHIRHTIESVLSQTEAHWELIVVDDASTDGTAKILDAFTDSRITVYHNLQNEHICYSLNTAAQLAKGQWIARIDADDFWYPQKLQQQLEYCREHPDCGACFTYVDVVDENDRVLKEKDSWFVPHFRVENQAQREDWQRLLLTQGCRLCHPSVMLRREAMQEGYQLALVQIQDYEMWLRIAKRFSLHVLTTPLMAYRASQDSVSARNQAVDRRSDYELGWMIAQYVREMPSADFAKVFGLKNVGASTPLDYACEKAFALLNKTLRAPFYRMQALNQFAQLLQTDEGAKCLREKYSFRPVDFYRLSGEDAAHGQEWAGTAENLPISVLLKAICKKMLQKAGLLEIAKRMVK